jgi:leucyl aminopeptidase
VFAFMDFGCERQACEPTPSDELAEELSVASKKAGEKFWRMPMEEGYWELMKINIADFVNTGSCAGGSITAALFLKQVIRTPSGLLACFPSFLHK